MRLLAVGNPAFSLSPCHLPSIHKCHTQILKFFMIILQIRILYPKSKFPPPKGVVFQVLSIKCLPEFLRRTQSSEKTSMLPSGRILELCPISSHYQMHQDQRLKSALGSHGTSQVGHSMISTLGGKTAFHGTCLVGQGVTITIHSLQTNWVPISVTTQESSNYILSSHLILCQNSLSQSGTLFSIPTF